MLPYNVFGEVTFFGSRKRWSSNGLTNQSSLPVGTNSNAWVKHSSEVGHPIFVHGDGPMVVVQLPACSPMHFWVCGLPPRAISNRAIASNRASCKSYMQYRICFQLWDIWIYHSFQTWAKLQPSCRQWIYPKGDCHVEVYSKCQSQPTRDQCPSCHSWQRLGVRTAQ